MSEQLTDRFPEPNGPDFATLEVESNINKEEEEKALMEMIDKLSTMGRRNRRKIIKPTFSKDVRKAFRKKKIEDD